MRTKIKAIRSAHAQALIGQEYTVKGWVRTARRQKNFTFVDLNDGSTLNGLQVVIDESFPNYEAVVSELTTGTALAVTGQIVESPGAGQAVELRAAVLEILGSCPAETYPLQKKRHSFEFLRTIAHLRPRTNTLGAVARIRNALTYATHQFFQQRGFIYLHTPIITGADCEGAGEMFRVTTLPVDKRTDALDFFGIPTFLTVSGQLNAEAYALALSDVYTFGPTFRAENSNTSRHLAEFWMVEPEMAFADLNDDCACAEAYLKSVLGVVLNDHREDMQLFDKHICPGLLERLEKVRSSPFQVMSYTEAVEVLLRSNKKFEFEVTWGRDLQSEHERYLCEEYVKGPVVVINYPKQIKAFYMRLNEDQRTVAAMDVLVPGVGEVIGGSQREERLDYLQSRLTEMQLPLEPYQWYLDLRRYGTVPHAGFGLGLERLILFVTGMENIRDVIPFPRTPGHAEF